MTGPPMFETARLTLRPFTGGDVDALATVFDDKEAMWDVLAIPDMPTESRAVAAHRIEESMSGWAAHGAGFWAVAIRTPELGRVGRIIGYCGYVNPAKSAAGGSSDGVLEVGWGIHPEFQRRGLAIEAMGPVLDDAFNRRRIDRLVAITDPGNHASRALIGRLGFAFDADLHAYGAAQVRYVLDREVYLGGG